MRKGNLFVISGPSGAGKGTIVNEAMCRVSDAWLSISATTRAPRDGEQEGIHYFFVTDAEFDSMIESGALLEWAHVHGKRYGTPRTVVEKHIASGEQVILEIDVQGALRVKEVYPQAFLIFIEPPGLVELKRRLVMRGSENEIEGALRLRNAVEELSLKDNYDVSFVNDDLNTCVNDVVEYINKNANL
ncbi:MAG: guanylate kinase [Eggerthellaceae bacterium]|nr:guanylate kinase [Eggerthellaceae bacterium]